MIRPQTVETGKSDCLARTRRSGPGAGFCGLRRDLVAPSVSSPADVAPRRKTLLTRVNPPLAILPRIGYVRNRPNWRAGRTGPLNGALDVQTEGFQWCIGDISRRPSLV